MLLAALLWLPAKRWLPYLGIFYLSQVGANLALEKTFGFAVTYPFGDLIGTLTGAVLFRRFGAAPARLDTMKEIAVLIVVAAVIGQTIGGFFGASLTHFAFEGEFFTTWMTRAASGAVGVAVIVPAVLTLPRILGYRHLSPLRLAELGLVTLAAAVLAYALLVYNVERENTVSLLYLLSPILLYAALRFQVPGAAVVNLITMAVIILSGLDRWAGSVIDDRFGALVSVHISQASLLVLFLPGLFIAALIQQLDKSNASLTLASERFLDFAEAASDWQWEMDADLNYTKFSDRFEEISGYTVADLSGSSRKNISLEPESENFKAHERDLKERRPFRSFHHWYRLPSGQPRLGEMSGKPVFDEQGNFTGYRGTGSDITDRFEAEKRFHAIFETANIAMLILETDGAVKAVNDRLCQLLGYDQQELLAMNIRDFTHPGDIEDSETNLENLGSGKVQLLEVEKRYITKSGDLIYGQASVAAVPGPTPISPLHFISAIHDVTLQKAQAVQIAESEARYRRAAHLARTGHWIWDNLLDCYEYCSPEMAEFFGSSVEDFLRVSNSLDASMDWIHPDDREEFAGALADMKGKTTGFNIVARVVLDEKTTRHFRFLTEGVYDDTGRLLRTHGVLMDISESQATEDALRQSQKLEAIGQLTGGVAHDFNNLLAIILGSLELMSDADSVESATALLKPAIEAVTRGSDLTKNMLSFARRARLEPKVTNLNDVVRNTKNWSSRALPATVEVETSLLAGLWKVKCDLSSTENAILNLILNARDAMTDGGRLTIETANLRIDEEYVESRHEDIEPGRYVMLAISDTGEGIPPQNIHSVFEPFFSTKGPGKGSGLGLSMVQGFMKQSGGSIRVYSEVGKGTTFKLYFPAVFDTKEDKSDAAATALPQVTSGTRILVVEDEPVLMTIIVTILERNGYQVISANSGDAALALFERSGPIDLLLTDIVMPGRLQGPNLAKELRLIQAITSRDIHVRFRERGDRTRQRAASRGHQSHEAHLACDPDQINRKSTHSIAEKIAPANLIFALHLFRNTARSMNGRNPTATRRHRVRRPMTGLGRL